MHEHRFKREIERLRDPERLERDEVGRVVALSLEKFSKAETILDIGSGSGVFAEEFAAKRKIVTGVDANPEMLLAARKFVPSATFKEAIAEKLPFADGNFDLCFMGLLLHETDDPLTALCEARRVSKEGVAVLEWPDEDQPFGPPRSERLSPEKISALAQEAGFKKVDALRLESLVLYLLV